MLKIIDVAIGKYTVKFSLLIVTSPGSFPMKGILLKNISTSPMPAMMRPIIKTAFPIPLKFSIVFLHEIWIALRCQSVVTSSVIIISFLRSCVGTFKRRERKVFRRARKCLH